MGEAAFDAKTAQPLRPASVPALEELATDIGS